MLSQLELLFQFMPELFPLALYVVAMREGEVDLPSVGLLALLLQNLL